MHESYDLLKAYIVEVLNPAPFTFHTGAPDAPYNDNDDPTCYYDSESGTLKSLDDDPLHMCDDVHIPITPDARNGGTVSPT